MENVLTCSECLKSINPNEEYKVIKTSKRGDIESVVCHQCWNNYLDTIEQETYAPNCITATIAGVVGAAIAGLIWYYFVTLTEIQFGLISIFMGWLVGKSVVWGSGNKRGKPLQFLSLSLTIIAIIFSEYLILNHYFIEEFGSGYGNLTLSDFLYMHGIYFTEASGFFSLLFYALALWQAYRTPKKRELVGITLRQVASVEEMTSERNYADEWNKSDQEKRKELDDREKEGRL